MNEKQIYSLIQSIVQNELKKKNLLTGQWHLGRVDQVISSKILKVFVDGSNVSQTIPCDPDRTYQVGDEVWVVYINGNSKDKQVFGKRPIS